MTNIAARNKRAGARWQADLRKGFRAEGFDIEELKLAGQRDEGDLVIRQYTGGPVGEYIVIEAKAGEMRPAQFVKEARIEAEHFRKHRDIGPELVRGIAIVKRRGANWKDAYVLTTVRDYFELGDS